MTGARRRRVVPYTPVCGWKSGRETRGWERDGGCASAEPGAGRAAGPRFPEPGSASLPRFSPAPREPSAPLPSAEDAICVMFSQS